MDRLLAAATAALANRGYPATTVGHIVGLARVSKPTFYDHFVDKEDCALAVLAAIDRRVLEAVRVALNDNAPELAHHVVITALVEFCRSEPAVAQVLINASLTGGSRTIDARYGTIASIVDAITDSQRRTSPHSVGPDIDGELLVGAVWRWLGSRLRKGAPLDADALSELVSWVKTYERPAYEHRWNALVRSSLTTTSTIVTEAPFGCPPVAPLHPTRARRLVHQRQRLLFATAELAIEKGIGPTTFTEIAQRAGVGYRKLRRFFPDKHAAFLLLHEAGYRRILMDSLSAYFSSPRWPDRVWAAADACTMQLAQNPTIAHVEIIEPYSLGLEAANRMDDVLKMFTVFLGEGRNYVRPPRQSPSDAAFDLIAAIVFELFYRECRAGNSRELQRTLPQVVFLALAPFLGAGDALHLIDEQLSARRVTAGE